MQTVLNPNQTGAAHREILLEREDDPTRPSLEGRVAYQWEGELSPDLVGHRTSSKRNRIVLTWLADAVRRGSNPKQVLDVGCAYGNHLFMLNGLLGKDQSVSFTGLDLSPHGLQFANAFAANVSGYSNCRFMQGDSEGKLPFANETFDAVNLSDVLEHLEDPLACLNELARVTKHKGTIVISTPLKTSLFKHAAVVLNKLSGGLLYKRYYAGKGVQLAADGQPIMDVHAGHDHISEMDYGELVKLCARANLILEGVEVMPIMSGSSWFDQHPFFLSFLLFLEACHDVFKQPSWGHSVCLRLTRP